MKTNKQGVRNLIKMMVFLALCIVAVASALAVTNIWNGFGNDQSLSMQYQAGSQDANLTIDKSITYNTELQPFVFDFDCDPDVQKEFVVFYTGYIRVYYASNFAFRTETATPFNKPISQDITDFDGDGCYEFITIASSASNSSAYYFNVYSYNGASVTTDKSFQIDLNFDPYAGSLKCGTDFNNDLNIDCVFLALTHGNSSQERMVGYDTTATSGSTTAFSIIVKAVGASPNSATTSVPEFVDANQDGKLEALTYGIENVCVTNRTASSMCMNFATNAMHLTARWYNRDGGNYEILTMHRIDPYADGGGMGSYYGGMRVSLYTIAGVNLWYTNGTQGCPALHGGTTGSNNILCNSGQFSLSLGYTNINDGRIYAYGSCPKYYFSQQPPYSSICAYDKDGNVFSQQDVPSDVIANSENKITWADMKDGSNLEAVMPMGVIGLDGVLKYSPMSSSASSYDGWCLPVDLNDDLDLEMVCSLSGKNTSIFKVGAGGAGYNARPTIEYVGLSNYYPKVNTADGIQIYASDFENDAPLSYLIDCDYQSGTDEAVEMYQYEGGVSGSSGYTSSSDSPMTEFSCQWSTSGTHVIKTWVNDVSHGADTGLLTDMSSKNRSVYVGEVSVSCGAPHRFFCDTFDYSVGLKYNNWIVSNTYDPLDDNFAPTNNQVFLQDNQLTLYHPFSQHTYPVISMQFNISVNYTDPDSQFHVMILHPNGRPQVIMTFLQGYLTLATPKGACVSGSPTSLYCNKTATTNNTWHHVVVNIFYDKISGLGGNILKNSNTYDVLYDGQFIAQNMPFWAGFDDKSDSNVTSSTVYSNYFMMGIYANPEVAYSYVTKGIKLDDLYLYKGTDFNDDNTAQLTTLYSIPTEESSTIPEYWGCYQVQQGAQKGYDCTYSKYNCQTCCGYVGGVLKVTKVGCTFGKVMVMWAYRFRAWFFKWMLYIVLIGGVGLVLVLLMRKLRGG